MYVFVCVCVDTLARIVGPAPAEQPVKGRLQAVSLTAAAREALQTQKPMIEIHEETMKRAEKKSDRADRYRSNLRCG